MSAKAQRLRLGEVELYGGCRCTDSEYTSLCAEHKQQFEEIHARWAAEHRATELARST